LEDALREVADHLRNLREQRYEHVFLYHRDLQSYPLKLLRNIKRYDESLVAYKRALEIDPKHRGAHEYIGIAYIQMSQLANAKIHLDALDKICTFSCEEYRDLKKAYLAATSTTK
jgi:tetratricopeptide (TPR) repeat protein